MSLEGIRVSQKPVTRLMQKHGLVSRAVKKYKATTDSKHSLPVYERYTVGLAFINQVWVSDITYVSTKEGWLYVASVMDLIPHAR